MTNLAAEATELDTVNRRPRLDPGHEKTSTLIGILAASEHDRGEDVSRPYLNREGEAALLGVKPGTVTRYRDRDPSYPAPVECPCCGSSVRDRVAVEAWRDSRPGQGAGGGRPPRKEQS